MVRIYLILILILKIILIELCKLALFDTALFKKMNILFE